MSAALASKKDVESVSGGDGEFPMTETDFKVVAAVLKEEAGICLAPTKGPLVYSRLTKRLRALGLSDFKQYCDHLMSSEGIDERKQMLMALTTNVTHFFREPHHFKTLEDEILPPLIERARSGGRVRLWSAGCSNGQEPYSIAMTLLSKMPDVASFDVKILATDIDPRMVAHGKSGVYTDAIVNAVPDNLRKKHFTQNRGDNSWTVSAELKNLISFKELNLLKPWPIKGVFDAIFCRNVVIYFDEETQQPLWSRFASALAPGGWIMIGHSERITGPSEDLFLNKGITTYRMRAGAS